MRPEAALGVNAGFVLLAGWLLYTRANWWLAVVLALCGAGAALNADRAWRQLRARGGRSTS